MSWYQKNKDKVTATKREQYKADSQAFKDRNKKYRSKVADGTFVKTKVVDGQVLYSLSTVASHLKVDPRTIKTWEQQGKIPAAFLVDKTRWYTTQDFLSIKENAPNQDKAST